MKIGIDATGIFGLYEQAPGGVINYTLRIIENLLKIDEINEYVIYCRNEVPESFREYRSPRVAFRVLKSRNRKLAQLLNLPVSAYFDGVDLLFFPFNSASLFCPCKSVVTLHDMHPFVVPEQFASVHSVGVHGGNWKSKINQFYWQRMMKIGAKKNHVIAPSKATKRDIQDILGTSSKKITVIYEGVDRARFNVNASTAELNGFRGRYQLGTPYVLCVGAHGYKNIPGALRAFANVKKSYTEPLNLVIAGNKRYIGDDIYQLVSDLNIEHDVIFPGYFPEEDIQYLYRCAELLLFPSFYEGFGLPVLEAFASGTPVVTSTAGSLPEVGGDVALLADPDNPEEIAAGILALLSDPAFKEKKRRGGLDWVKRFSWTKAAEDTLVVFQQTV